MKNIFSIFLIIVISKASGQILPPKKAHEFNKHLTNNKQKVVTESKTGPKDSSSSIKSREYIDDSEKLIQKELREADRDLLLYHYQDAATIYLKYSQFLNSEREYNLGNLYYMGQGVDKDYEIAMQWFQKSAETPNVNAFFKIGYLFAYGLGVSRNFEEARIWYEKAAERGHSGAMYELGKISPNIEMAMNWYRKSANQGNSFAMIALGDIYAGGILSPEDTKEAKEWYVKAARQGNPEAVTRLKSLGEIAGQDSY